MPDITTIVKPLLDLFNPPTGYDPEYVRSLPQRMVPPLPLAADQSRWSRNKNFEFTLPYKHLAFQEHPQAGALTYPSPKYQWAGKSYSAFLPEEYENPVAQTHERIHAVVADTTGKTQDDIIRDPLGEEAATYYLTEPERLQESARGLGKSWLDVLSTRYPEVYKEVVKLSKELNAKRRR
jgi:hypothetical protein